MKVQPLVGIKSLWALNSFHKLMLGVKMLPAYMGLAYEEFYERVEAMPPGDQEKVIREAVLFVDLNKDEVEALACFACDPNGIPYGPENLKSLGPDKLVEIMVAVCVEIAKIKINFVTEAEKKN